MTPQELSQVQAIVNEASGASQWVPAIAAILGAFVGAIAAFIPNLIVESHRFRKESCIVEASLIAEMTALIEIADERRYLSSIEQAIAHLETQPEGATLAFGVNVPSHYSRVYQANAHRIGMIQEDKATDIIRFHQLIDAVVQDVSDGGLLSAGGSVGAFKENQQILSRAFEIGRKYTGRT